MVKSNSRSEIQLFTNLLLSASKGMTSIYSENFNTDNFVEIIRPVMDFFLLYQSFSYKLMCLCMFVNKVNEEWVVGPSQ